VALRCLIIDDRADVLDALKASLEADGVEVIATATAADDGIERALEHELDCILIDVDLGEESGVDVAARLADLGVRATRILISAYREYAALADDTPVAGFLSKTAVSRAAIEQLMA
jgi:two-component system nitrate/nitrite response regulator NarL